ncbi:hypothetical protein GA0061081_11433 [Gilliamella bombicola]|uniref:Uncharacterized protein n=1 Tax=Gilliamella bombicola TaxID=1798182 RepID=A0A1C4D8J0_9GAMM|nr:hypothetical protein [Gilliamella bombicola]SCC27649.1 hypothetical protein GA0061081_11433 [Gilliamella bombicola]
MQSDKIMSNSKIDKIDEIKKPFFWISQLFILNATVVGGGCLAANQGYKQAVQFENMRSYKKTPTFRNLCNLN